LGLAGQVAALPLDLEDERDGRLPVRQLDFADLHLLLVLDAQVAAGVAVEKDVTPFPDQQGVAAALVLDALFERPVLAPRLQRDQPLKRGIDLQAPRIRPAPAGRVGGFGFRLSRGFLHGRGPPWFGTAVPSRDARRRRRPASASAST
jgi:hypothetical protein